MLEIGFRQVVYAVFSCGFLEMLNKRIELNQKTLFNEFRVFEMAISLLDSEDARFELIVNKFVDGKMNFYLRIIHLNINSYSFFLSRN